MAVVTYSATGRRKSSVARVAWFRVKVKSLLTAVS